MKKKIELTKYYRQQLEPALEFQDFVVDFMLKKYGLTIMTYASSKYQNNKGESKTGIEVKHDNEFRRTGRLYIERHEKRNPKNKFWAPSFLAKKNSDWLIIIGDYDTLYMLSKKQILEAIKKGKLSFIETSTSQGYVIPLNSPLIINKIEIHQGEIEPYDKNDNYWL